MRKIVISFYLTFFSLSIFASNEGRPNILLLVSEDNGPQLGCYGDPFAHTPNLDELGNKGVIFGKAYVTQAGCSPSRASIFTGSYPHSNINSPK